MLDTVRLTVFEGVAEGVDVPDDVLEGVWLTVLLGVADTVCDTVLLGVAETVRLGVAERVFDGVLEPKNVPTAVK